MEPLARIIWVAIPALATRLSRPLGGILSDGQYFTANANLAVIVPAAAFVAGLLTGFIHPDAIFTASLPLTALLLLFGCLGSGIGAYAWIGYVIGDLPHLAPGGGAVVGTQGGHYVFGVVGPLGHLYSYLVLAMLVVVLPIGAKSLRDATAAVIPGGDNLVLQIVLGGAMTAGLVFLWRLAMPIMVRPVFTLEGNIATVESVSTIQKDLGLLLVFEAALVGAARGFLDATAKEQQGYQAATLELMSKNNERSVSDAVPAIVRVIGRAVFTVLLLVGLMNSLIEAAVAFVGVAGIMAAGSLVLPRLTFYTDLAGKIPIVLRLIAALVISAVVGYAIVSFFFTSTSSLFPVLIAALLSIGVMVVAIPEGAITLMAAQPKPQAAP